MPITLVILTVLFAIQRFGTGAVGRLFGPVMGLWFAILALSGLREVVHHPGILRALSPSYGVSFLADHGSVAFIALGLGRADGHRRRGALRRHGPLRPPPDPPRVVRRSSSRR